MVTQAVGTMLPNGRVAGTTKEIETQASQKRITDMVTKEDTNPQAVDKGVKLILQSVRESASWTRDLFLLIRMCKEVEIAWGSLVTAEARAVAKFKEMINTEDPSYAGKIKNLNDVAKYNGDKQLSYQTTKSKLKGIIDNADELCSSLQEWWLFQAKHDGAPHKSLADGFLDVMSKRYEDEKKGSTLFMRDAREAQAAEGILAARKAQLEKDQKKDAAAQTGQNGDQTRQGVVSGTNVDQKGLQVKSTQEALNKVIRLVHDADNHEGVEIDALNGILSQAAQAIAGLIDKANQAIKDAVSSAGSKPIVEPRGDASETGETSNPLSDDETTAETSSVQPDWIPQDTWSIMTEEERAHALTAGKDAWDEEEEMMVRANEIDDAGANEPKSEEDKAAEVG